MTAPSLRLVVFTVSGQKFALPAAEVREILALPRLAHPPGLPEELEGLLTLAGRIVPVYRLAVLLGGAPPEVGLYTPLLLVEPSGGGAAALLVDRVHELAAVAPLAVLELDPGTAAAPGLCAEVTRAGETLHLLDLDQLLGGVRAEAVR